MKKRTRACGACHNLKTKCEMPSDAEAGHDACTRCHRFGLECSPAPPKLQRDRITELEAQVESLTRALRERSGSISADSTPISGSSKTGFGAGAGIPSSSSPAAVSDSTAGSILSFLDGRTSLDDQRRALNSYSCGFKAVWCPANLSSQDLTHVRNHSPLLLLAIMAFPMAAEVCGDSSTIADELVNGAVDSFAQRVFVEGAQNTETVRALLTAAFWHRIPRGQVAAHCHQLSRLAIDMAVDIGLGGAEFPGSPAVYFRRMDGHEDPDSGRTWLACYASACMYSLNVRAPLTIRWAKQHERSLMSVESSKRFEDRLFCHIIRIISLCEEAAVELELCNLTLFHDVNEAPCQEKMARMMERFREWSAQVPSDLVLHPMVRFWSFVFGVYLHEVVLHTPTNKTSFAAPHVPANLSVTNFAAPGVVTDAAAAAMCHLIEACQGAILACEDMGPAEVLAAPSSIFAPAVMYALKVLVQVFITVNGPASTFGASSMIPKDKICMREYISKVMVIAKAVESATHADTYWTGRILGASAWLNTWSDDYEAILRRYDANQQRKA